MFSSSMGRDISGDFTMQYCSFGSLREEPSMCWIKDEAIFAVGGILICFCIKPCHLLQDCNVFLLWRFCSRVDLL